MDNNDNETQHDTNSSDPHHIAQKHLDELLKKMLRDGIIRDPEIELAFRAVPRHHFLPDHELKAVYADQAIALKRNEEDRVISSSSQPTMMAIMLDQLQIEEGDNILEIGTASGFNAALLKYLVGRRGNVTTIELDNDLARSAKDHLHRAHVQGVTVVHADGAKGYSPRASYDSIIATAGVWDLPPSWLQQLKPNGRIVAPILLDGIQISATFIPQSDDTYLSKRNHPCSFVYMRGSAKTPEVYRQVGNTSLYIYADEVEKIDTAALHLLLSDDHAMSYLGNHLTPRDFWYGFQLYLMVNEPKDFIFATYAVYGDKKVYGLEGRGIAFFAPASASFASYSDKGNVHTYAGSDSGLELQRYFEDWEKAGRPSIDQLRIRLIPKDHGEPEIETGRVYKRHSHYLHVWIESETEI